MNSAWIPVLTRAISVEEIKGFFDLFPLLRRQTLAAAFVFPVVTTRRAGGSLLASVIARLHGRTHGSAQHVVSDETLPTPANNHHWIFKRGQYYLLPKNLVQSLAR